MTGSDIIAAISTAPGRGGIGVVRVSGPRLEALISGIVRTPLIGEGADAMASLHPLGRIGEVRDTSDAALFLATAGFVTGIVLEVDGGYAHGR